MTSNYSFCVMKTLTPIIEALHRAKALCNIICSLHPPPLPPPLPSLGCRGRRLLNNIICNGWSDGTTGLLSEWAEASVLWLRVFFFLLLFFIKADLWRSAENPGRSTYASRADISAIRSSDYHSKYLCLRSLTPSSIQLGVAMETQT